MRVIEHLRDIDPGAWDALSKHHPLLSHAFFSALLESGSATAETGWDMHSLTWWEGKKLTAALPLFKKNHSYGEYVFDWAWAEAMHRAGRPYYPKLLSAIPFTPCPGARLLTQSSLHDYLPEVMDYAKASGLSSLHVLFCPEQEAKEWEAAGCLLRQGVQFHWARQGAAHFEDYLTSLTQAKRKRIKQERRKVMEAGLRFEHKAGHDINENDWAFFYQCYCTTYAEHRSTPYLSLEFFKRIQSMSLLILGYHEQQAVCAAFFIKGNNTLYGRYWGTSEHLSGLHFETCYYQAIEYCCAQGIDTFEGGAQGEHKLARGFLPTATYSAHWLRDADMRDAVANYLKRETTHMNAHINELAESSPYKHS